MGIKVTEPGLLTTVQDRGRRGYMAFGVTPAGVMDARSCEIANRLVGNAQGEAVLECTMLGPALEFTADAVFAVTGGDLQPQLSGAAVPMYAAVSARKGDVLRFGGRKSGLRAYIAFRGGLDVPAVMGSRATDLKTSIGGVEGRKLRAGDEIAFGAAQGAFCAAACEAEDFSGGEKTLRVIPGPQEEHFTEKGVETFFSAVYTVTPKSDRMGCRLDGAAVETKNGSDIITDGISMGAVQIPSDGRPIIMMADRQTTGGYAKIANVISVDLPLAAQLMPGDRVRFRAVSVQEAQELLLAQQKKLAAIGAAKPLRRYRVNVNGTVFDATVESVE